MVPLGVSLTAGVLLDHDSVSQDDRRRSAPSLAGKRAAVRPDSREPDPPLILSMLMLCFLALLQ